MSGAHSAVDRAATTNNSISQQSDRYNRVSDERKDTRDRRDDQRGGRPITGDVRDVRDGRAAGSKPYRNGGRNHRSSRSRSPTSRSKPSSSYRDRSSEYPRPRQSDIIEAGGTQHIQGANFRRNKHADKAEDGSYDDNVQPNEPTFFGGGNRSDKQRAAAAPAITAPAAPIDMSAIDGDASEEQILAMMGLPSGFNSTKGKEVADPAAHMYGARLKSTRKYRQYMNRRGGFNRNLAPVQ